MAFTGRCTITPQTGQVPSSQSNYAVLVSVTNANLKSVSNGGLVQSASGYDIRAFSDSGLTSALKFYRQYYDPVTGTLRMRIKIPTLTAGTPYYLGFGDATLTTDANDGPNTFSNYSGVWPLEDGSSLILTDITGGGFNGSGFGGVGAGTGILGAGALMDASDDYIRIAPNLAPWASEMTISCMIKSNDLSQTKVVWAKRTSMTGEPASNECFLLYTTSAGKVQFNVSTTGSLNETIVGGTTLSTGTIYVLHGVRRGFGTFDLKVFVNGTSDGTSSGNSGSISTASAPIHFGDDGSAGRFFNGTFRNFELSANGRADSWCLTDANCWLAPSTFATYSFDSIATVTSRTSFYLIG